ncbi:MAG: 5-deoxy-glucuronate isomerase [Bryobacteraceae bacterium]
MSALLVRPEASTSRPAAFGYRRLSFQARKMAAGEHLPASTGACKPGIVALGGHCTVDSAYLPAGTTFTLTALTACDLALCYSRAEQTHPARLVTPDQAEVEIRGSGILLPERAGGFGALHGGVGRPGLRPGAHGVGPAGRGGVLT